MKLYWFSIILVFFMLISVVSAEDINSTDSIGNDADIDWYLSENTQDTILENDETSEVFSNSENVIVNPDFEDGLNGWECTGSVSTNNEKAYDGTCAELKSEGSSISQIVNWSSVNKFYFYHKSDNSDNFFYVKIGDTILNYGEYYPDVTGDPASTGDWGYFEYDTSSYTDSSNLTIVYSGCYGGGSIYIDEFGFALDYPPVIKDTLIYNPEFSEGLKGWNTSGSVFSSKNGKNGSGVSFISTGKAGQRHTLSQNIDWTLIESINFYYKTECRYTLEVCIGEILILQIGNYDNNEWVNFTYDTSSIKGFKDLTFEVSAGQTKGKKLYLDSIEYLVTKTTPSISLDSNNSNVVVTITSGNDPIKGATLNYTIDNGVSGSDITDANGQIVISGLIGLVNITVTYEGSELYNGNTASKVFDFTIPTNNVTITIPEITAGKTTTIPINLPANASGNITVTIDGKVSSVTNLTNGSATITIPELTAGKHNIVISYSGDGIYAGFSKNSTIEVKESVKPTPKPEPVKPTPAKKQATKIVAKKKTFKAKVKVKKYTITLKTKAGKAVKKVKVTLKIKGKTYKAKTNKKGKATFKIKKLTKKAKYTAKIKFPGNKLYKGVTKKVKITVKK